MISDSSDQGKETRTNLIAKLGIEGWQQWAWSEDVETKVAML